MRSTITPNTTQGTLKGTSKGTFKGASRDTTRENLLKAAIHVFAEKGYDGATVKDLAAAAGVNIALISYHFGGKEKLFRQCLENLGKDRLKASVDLLKKASTKEEFQIRFKLWVHQFIEIHVEQPQVCQLICRQMQENFENLRDIFQNTFLQTFHTLFDYFKQGKKQGFISPHLDPYIVSVVVFGAIVHSAQTQHLQKDFFKKSLQDTKFRNHFVDQLCAIIQQGAIQQ